MSGHNDAEFLNSRAWFALKGFAADWSTALVDLLRSDAPIYPELRQELATAIEGETVDGTKLRLSGQKLNRDRFVGMASRDEYMKIGAWIKEVGLSRSKAVEAASKQFNASIEKCDAALVYYDRVTAWLEGPHASQFNRAFQLVRDADRRRKTLITLFHEHDRTGEPLDRAASD